MDSSSNVEGWKLLNNDGLRDQDVKLSMPKITEAAQEDGVSILE